MRNANIALILSYPEQCVHGYHVSIMLSTKYAAVPKILLVVPTSPGMQPKAPATLIQAQIYT